MYQTVMRLVGTQECSYAVFRQRQAPIVAMNRHWLANQHLFGTLRNDTATFLFITQQLSARDMQLACNLMSGPGYAQQTCGYLQC